MLGRDPLLAPRMLHPHLIQAAGALVKHLCARARLRRRRRRVALLLVGAQPCQLLLCVTALAAPRLIV